MKDLFLCHASEDKERLVRPVHEELIRRKLSCWLDEGEIQAGMDIDDMIYEGMKEAHATAVFFTKYFPKKYWTNKELEDFIAMGKPIIPVVFDLDEKDISNKYPSLSSIRIISEISDTQEIARLIECSCNSMQAKDNIEFNIKSGFETCRGTFRRPVENSKVDRNILAEGDIIGFPKEASLWLVIEIGALKWPKEPCVSITGNSWVGEAFEGGTPPNGEFKLALYIVGKEGNIQINDWLENGHKNNSYPGIKILKGARKLDCIKLKLR
ncbi:MAG: toll/interleukin-1 receptor domain-containing protein [Clostridia bacterium]|nr:toll/interleukin-1 receptor domain-containing protein [Clostridia bacterium]MDD4048615.1 toll/interleukin-1 receptor domain-containing protein [Clostridia bacterium]